MTIKNPFQFSLHSFRTGIYIMAQPKLFCSLYDKKKIHTELILKRKKTLSIHAYHFVYPSAEVTKGAKSSRWWSIVSSKKLTPNYVDMQMRGIPADVEDEDATAHTCLEKCGSSKILTKKEAFFVLESFNCVTGTNKGYFDSEMNAGCWRQEGSFVSVG